LEEVYSSLGVPRGGRNPRRPGQTPQTASGPPAASVSSNEGSRVTGGPSRQMVSITIPMGGIPGLNMPMESVALEGIFQQILSNVAGGDRGHALHGINFDVNFPFPLFQMLHGNPGDYAWGSGGLDSVITQLLNNLDGTGPPPMPSQDITKLPTVLITSQETSKNLQCTVCMEDFVLNEPVRQLACGHMYHNDCIVPWLEMHGSCPICRKLFNNQSGEDASSTETATASQAQTNPPSSGAPSTGRGGSSTYYDINEYD